MSEIDMDETFDDLIANALGIQVFSYSSIVTDEVWAVIKDIKENRPASNREIAARLGLKESHVELIQYLVCNNYHADYGTSPRGCWLTDKGETLYEKLKELRP